MKSSIKRYLTRIVLYSGRAGWWDWCGERVFETVIPRLMDPNTLPSEPTWAPLRGLGASIPCHPYAAHHIRPFWTGVLAEQSLDRLLRRLLKPGDTFIDIGANLGHVTFLASGLVGPRGRVHAVEAHPWLASALRVALASQKLKQVDVHSVALGDDAGSMDLHVCLSNIGASSLRDNVEPDLLRAHRDEVGRQLLRYAAEAAGVDVTRDVPPAITVEVVRADDLFSDFDSRGPVYAKIDVEGFEIHVVEGMTRLLESTIRGVVVEITPPWIGGPAGVERLFELFHRASFCGYVLDPENETIDPQPARAAGIVEQRNVFFARNEVAERLGLSWDPPLPPGAESHDRAPGT